MADIYQKIAFINDVYDAYKKGSVSRLKLLAINWKQYADETIQSAQDASNYATLASQKATDAENSANTATAQAAIAISAAQSAQSAVQSDWTEADATARAYIKNKPSITSNITSGSDSLLTSGGAYNAIHPIEEVIPSAATSSNQLADKQFVNSSISSNTANFIGTFNSVAELEAYSGTLTNNDYAFVATTDAAGNTLYDRYKYTTGTNPASWVFEYELNNSSFTSDQWAAINSGVTSSDVTLIATALQPNDNVSSLVNDSNYVTSSTLADYQLIAPDFNVLSTSGTIALTDNSINTITPSAAVTFTLPTVTDNTVFHQILVQINLSTAYTIDLGLGATPHYFNSKAPDLSNAGVYNLYYEYDKANQYWVCGELQKGVAS